LAAGVKETAPSPGRDRSRLTTPQHLSIVSSLTAASLHPLFNSLEKLTVAPGAKLSDGDHQFLVICRKCGGVPAGERRGAKKNFWINVIEEWNKYVKGAPNSNFRTLKRWRTAKTKHDRLQKRFPVERIINT